MNLIYLISIFALAIISCLYLIKAFYDLKNGIKHKYGFLIILSGMIIGVGIGVLIFFQFDWTKGWNPYGWWFLATFGAALIGGLVVTLIYGYFDKKYSGKKSEPV